MHPAFKEFRSIVNWSWIHNNAKRIDFNLLFTYSLLFFNWNFLHIFHTPHPVPLLFHRTKKCRARPGMRSLARHFFLVILPSSLFQPFCCVRSLVSKTLLFCVCTDITLPLTPGQNERVCLTHARGTWLTNYFLQKQPRNKIAEI